MKINIQRIFPVILSVFLVFSLAVPAFALPVEDIPEYSEDSIVYTYIVDYGAPGSFTLIEPGYYRFSCWSDKDVINQWTRLFEFYVHISSFQSSDMDGLFVQVFQQQLQIPLPGDSFDCIFNMMQSSDLGGSLIVLTDLNGDRLPLDDSLVFLLTPVSTSPVPDLSPSAYVEFSPVGTSTTRWDFDGFLEPGTYYVIAEFGDAIYFSQKFELTPVSNEPDLVEYEFNLPLYCYFTDSDPPVGLYYDDFFFLGSTNRSTNTYIFTEGDLLSADRVLFVPVKHDYDVVLEFWDYLLLVIRLSFTRYRSLFFSDNGLSLAGFVVVGFFAVGICFALIVLLRRVFGFRS